jgi:hypothetical protein
MMKLPLFPYGGDNLLGSVQPAVEALARVPTTRGHLPGGILVNGP